MLSNFNWTQFGMAVLCLTGIYYIVLFAKTAFLKKRVAVLRQRAIQSLMDTDPIDEEEEEVDPEGTLMFNHQELTEKECGEILDKARDLCIDVRDLMENSVQEGKDHHHVLASIFRLLHKPEYFSLSKTPVQPLINVTIMHDLRKYYPRKVDPYSIAVMW